eukprot:CAMPEP_0185803164 /NCGR_PEP_ID=MMETSP1322-20130828/2452_1 /TAXON_ID=265543 /ORGANISM="Minutocellus polymorphus, Strain RCC2270" /LENGTH=297 /DNA_ID=CAMNT_0028499007 /DNA_START=70 /DNA_END=963 /DNA_ORIENTATION=-
MDRPEPSLLLPSLGMAAHNCKSSPDTCKTSQSSPEESSPTGSTSGSSTLPVDEERMFETPPPSPFSRRRPTSDVTLTADDGRQPPSPLGSAASTEKIQPLAPCLVQEIDGANCGKQGSRRRRRRRRNVTFTTVTIHHHPPTLSDNPAVSDGGAPVGISWSRTHTHHQDVDAYEADRQNAAAGSERRTSVQQLRMTGAKRRLLLLRAGHTERELDDMIEEVRRVQIGRARTNGTAGRGLDISGKTRRVKEAGARARRHVGRVVDAMDRATTIRIQPVGRAVLEFDHGAAAAAVNGSAE